MADGRRPLIKEKAAKPAEVVHETAWLVERKSPGYRLVKITIQDDIVTNREHSEPDMLAMIMGKLTQSIRRGVGL